MSLLTTKNYSLITDLMVGVAQLVEHQVVALVAAGSSPVAHPNQLQCGVQSAGVRSGAMSFIPNSAF